MKCIWRYLNTKCHKRWALHTIIYEMSLKIYFHWHQKTPLNEVSLKINFQLHFLYILWHLHYKFFTWSFNLICLGSFTGEFIHFPSTLIFLWRTFCNSLKPGMLFQEDKLPKRKLMFYSTKIERFPGEKLKL